jgi:drug/metabolite transporter (DMT)-like permease
MQNSKFRLALYALLTAVLLNCIGLVTMRMLAGQINAIFALFIGYSLAALPLFSSKLSGRPILPKTKRDCYLIPMWGIALSSIYFLFITYPTLVTPSQVILGLTLAPLSATFLSGDLSFKEAFTIHKLKIAPIFLLLLLGVNETNGRSNHSIWTFFLIWFLFSMSQTAARKLSKNEMHFYAQSRMAVVVATALIILTLIHQTSHVTMPTVYVGSCFGLLLTIVFRFTLYGIKNTTPIEAALLLSLNVPFSLTAEALMLGRKINWEQILIASIYVSSVAIIQFQMQANKPLPNGTDLKP